MHSTVVCIFPFTSYSRSPPRSFSILTHFLYSSVPPVIDESSVISSPEVVVNKTIILHCPASGVPIPTITWFKDDEQLENDTRTFLLDDGWRIQISEAKTSDIARYSCRAVNKAGNAEKYFDLQVLGKVSAEEFILVMLNFLGNSKIYLQFL